MTDDRSLERAARAWLEPGPTRAPDDVVEGALLRIHSINQERDWVVPWRNQSMTVPVRLLVAAIALALAGVASAFILRPSSNVGATPSGPSTVDPSPSASATPFPSASASPVRAPAPDTTLGDWQAISDEAIPGLLGSNERIQLSIDWQDGRNIWIQTVAENLVLRSESLQAAANEIRVLTANGAEAVGCSSGEIGRYGWSRSLDGLFLTLTAVDEACSSRRAALDRTWVHSLSAVTDGGAGVLPLDGWVRMVLPDQRFGLSGAGGLAVLRSLEGPERSLAAIKDPKGLDAPCAAARQPVAIPPTTAGFVTYVRGLPGFTVATNQVTVAGNPAVRITMTPTGSDTCLDGEIAAFVANAASGSDAELPLSVGQSHSLWIVDVNGHTYLFTYEGDGVTPDEETSVIASFEFLDELPTP